MHGLRLAEIANLREDELQEREEILVGPVAFTITAEVVADRDLMAIATDLLYHPGVRALLFFLGALAAALIVRLFFSRILGALASRTKSDLDDLVIERIGSPAAWSILALGVWYALVPLQLSESMRHLAQGLLSSMVVLLWTMSGFSITKLGLERMSDNAERMSFLKPRTLPVFTFMAQMILIAGATYFFFLSWDIDVTAWLASAGIIGVAVGFGAKDTLANLFAGVFIVADGPYQIGDYLVVENGVRGRVTDIGIRSTRIFTLDEVEIIIPNAVMGNATIVNLSGGPNERTRLKVPIGVAYDSDMQVVRDTLLDIALNTKRVLKSPKSIVRVNTFGDSSINVTLLVWIGKPEVEEPVLDALNTAIIERFREANIQIPFPQREVAIVREEVLKT